MKHAPSAAAAATTRCHHLTGALRGLVEASTTRRDTDHAAAPSMSAARAEAMLCQGSRQADETLSTAAWSAQTQQLLAMLRGGQPTEPIPILYQPG